MILSRYIKEVDGTIPVPALLYDDEELFGQQDNVGIYNGTQKSSKHQMGTVYITSHRLFYIDAARKHSFALLLGTVLQTEYYAGLFRSSAKISLHLVPVSTDITQEDLSPFDAWECEVCAHRNPPGLSPAAASVCALCGVPRSAIPTRTQSTPPSLPSSTSLPSLDPSIGIACPVCTFLNHRYLRKCEICDTVLPVSLAMKSAPSSRPASPDEDEQEDTNPVIKLSFRKGGDKTLYAVLKRSLKSKSWESNSSVSTNKQFGGISGLLNNVESSAQKTRTGMTDALQDLEAFMVKAKDMVRLAAELNERLTASTTMAMNQPEEATFIRSSMSQLGLQMANTPATLDMGKDERKWIDTLAGELARVLQGDGQSTGMMKERGIIALDEVWGGWNRARGVALMPPDTFLQVVPHLPAHTSPPISKRTFASGLSVLHLPAYSYASFTARVCGLLTLSGPRSTISIAQDEGISVGLASEMISAVENGGEICRDDLASAIVGGTSGASAEVKWWLNIFRNYVWDGDQIPDED